MSENDGETRLYFPTVVREVQIKNAAEINKQIDAGIEKIRKTEPNTIPAGWSCELYTTFGSRGTLKDHEEFAPLCKVIVEQAEEFAAILELDTKFRPLIFTQCWLNIYGEGHAQELHTHANNVISGIYYVKAPAGSGDLLIHSPYHDTMLDPPFSKTNGFNMNMVPIKPKEGKMILFRSYTKHSVKPTKSAEERISIAFNMTM